MQLRSPWREIGKRMWLMLRLNMPGARFWALCILLLMPPLASAYHPETGHAPLMRVAISQYLQCTPSSRLLADHETDHGAAHEIAHAADHPADSTATSVADSLAASRLLQGNLAMDHGLGFSFSGEGLRDWWRLEHDDALRLPKRLLHWHFYNPDQQTLAKIGLIDQSMLGLWQQLQAGWAANSAPHDKLLFVGGLAHFIEDLTVPAHVVPVYHGPTAVYLEGPRRLRALVDYYVKARPDTGAMIDDAIDSWPVDTAQLRRDLTADKNLCAQHHASVLALRPDHATSQRENSQPSWHGLDRLRDTTARQTLALLQQAIPGCPGVYWQDFWQAPTPGQYFGRYNMRQPLFGEAGDVEGAGGARCQMQAADPRYHAFVAQLHRQAVLADMMLLGWFEHQQSAEK